MGLSGLSGLSGLYGSVAATIPTANMVTEYRFDEGSGQLLRNRVNASPPAVANLIGGPEQVFNNTDLWNNVGYTITENFAADPLGGNNATRMVCAAGNRYIYQVFTLTAGAHTQSLWVKSNTGSAQSIRMQPQSTSPDIVVPTTWTRISYTFTATAGGTNNILVMTNVAQEALDILIYGAQLEVGSSANTYQAQALDHILGKTGGVDATDPAWSAGYLTFGATSKQTRGIASTWPTLAQLSAYALIRWNGT